jgi:hypothetical protein
MADTVAFQAACSCSLTSSHGGKWRGMGSAVGLVGVSCQMVGIGAGHTSMMSGNGVDRHELQGAHLAMREPTTPRDRLVKG